MTNIWGTITGQSRPLSKQIKAKIKAASRSGRFQEIGDWFSQIYIPSWPSFTIVALTSGIFIALGHWDILGLRLLAKSNDYANLIAVHAGIGAIIFALVIFIAESLRDDTDKDRARVLLKVSLLFPLTVAEIFVFFGFLWGTVNWIMAFTVACVGILAVYSISMLLLTLLSPFRFSRYRIALLKDRIKTSIGGAIDQRYGNEILFEPLGKEIKLTYYPFIHKEEEESFIIFIADKTGVIVDIKMDLLEKISDLLEREANRNGYSFDRTLSRAGSAERSSRITSEKKTEYKKDDKRYLLKKYRDEIDDEDMNLICAHKEVIKDPGVISEVARLAKNAFVIGSAPNFSEEIISELDGIEDQFFVAIAAGRLTRIKEFSKAYIALAESFLDLLKQHGGGYTYEQAKKELGNFIGEWSEMRWLADSIADVLLKSFATDNREIISEVAYLPMAICISAMKAGDNYLFQKFVNFPTMLYHNASGKRDDVREFMIDRSYRWLKEMVDFYIEPPIRDSIKQEQIEKYRDFGLPIFAAFLRLAKEAVEKNDTDSLTKILAEFEDLYDGFAYPHSPDVQQLQWMLEGSLDPNEKERIEKRLEVEKTREAVKAEIAKKKREMMFGLAAWTLKRYSQNPEDVYAKAIFGIVEPHLPRDIKVLTEIFGATHNPRTADFWGWDMWDVPSDGHVHNIDTTTNVERLYTVEILKLLSNMTTENIGALSLPPSEDIAFLARPASSLGTLLSQIETNPGNWHFALTDAQIGQIPNLKTLLKKAEASQEKNEKQIIANADLSSKKLGEFKDNFWKGFDGTAIVRNIAEKLSIVKEKPLPKTHGPEVQAFGFNQVAEKDPFVDECHTIYMGNGEQYGRALAYAENDSVLQSIVTGFGTMLEIELKSVYATLENTIRDRKLDPANLIILESLGYPAEYDQIKNNPNFLDVYRKGTPKTGFENIQGYIGCLNIENQPVPVFQMMTRKGSLKNKIIVLDSRRMGSWNQYPPVDEDGGSRERHFVLNITDLNQDEALRTKIASQDLPWLKDISDKENYLKGRVLIYIQERFEFTAGNADAGFCLIVAGKNDIDNDEGDD